MREGTPSRAEGIAKANPGSGCLFSLDGDTWHAFAEDLRTSSRSGEMVSEFCGERKYARNSFT
jgi:hypothetical protein